MTVKKEKSRKISRFFKLPDRSVGHHLDAASRKSLEIRAYCTSQNKEPIRKENLCKCYFVTALILYRSKNLK